MANKKNKKKARKSKKKSSWFSSSRKKRRFSLWRWCAKWLFIAGLWGASFAFILLVYFAYDLPDVAKLDQDIRSPKVVLLASDGSKITSFGNIYGDYIAYKDYPQHLIDAVLSTEDRRFFYHFGMDPIGLLRALYVNYKAGRVVQGGSTITQQLAKVVFLTPERSIKRKVQELILALYLERHFSKEDILTMYFNRIYMGAGNYGMDAAARSYFGKSISQVNLYEAAILAGLIKAPSRYAPSRNPQLAEERADQVMLNMVDNEVLSPLVLIDKDLVPQPQMVRNQSKSTEQYYANWIKEQLGDYMGSTQEDVTVRTTLDPHLQQLAKQTLHSFLSKVSDKHDVSQGAMVVMTPQGQVRAMVGGVSYKESQFNRVTQAFRQPGSAFKLFVYLTALEKGYHPSDHIVDEPIDIDGWMPGNWNDEYIGAVSLHDAFANSINTVAVRLTKQLGLANVIDTAHRLGMTSHINNDLSSALGTSEVSLLELTGAYAHLANRGKAVWVHGIEQVAGADNAVIYERSLASEDRVITSESVAQMNAMLVDVIDSGTGSNARLARQAAGKTGTSQRFRDAWFIGFTHEYVVGVWVGNDDNSPMIRVGGAGLPAKIWQAFMAKAHRGIEKRAIATTKYSVENNNSDDSIWSDFLKRLGTSTEPTIEYRYPANKRQ